VKALASFIPCSPGVPHRADIAHKALIVTAGFPKYEALRGFRCVPQWGVGRFVAREPFASNGHAMASPTDDAMRLCGVLLRESHLRVTATPWRGPTDDHNAFVWRFVAREAFASNGHAMARPYFVECAIA
jgi:hypothetical protein